MCGIVIPDMPRFSQRNGIRPLTKIFQRETVSKELRIYIWNILWKYYWNTDRLYDKRYINIIDQHIWSYYYVKPIDQIPCCGIDYIEYKVYEYVKNTIFNGKWWEVFDIVEFLLSRLPNDWAYSLVLQLNNVFELENSAYRIIDIKITEIVDKEEIDEIEKAIEGTTESVQDHLRRAIELLSDRKSPDYRNSIKESISAVEALLRELTGDGKVTLSAALKKLEASGVYIHPALRKGLVNIYGYTSDESGIRHALIEEGQNPDFADAKFMLVAATAFINYLRAKG